LNWRGWQIEKKILRTYSTWKFNPEGDDVFTFRIEILKWNYYLSENSKPFDVEQTASII
jgi:hypothetical protein